MSAEANTEWDTLRQLGAAIRKQDNCATSFPLFVVQQRNRLYGFDPDYSEDSVWIDTANDCREADAQETRDIEAQYNRTGKEPDGWTRTAYQDRWEFVTACLTRAGADRYIERQRHNLKDPRVYVESGYRNDEWIALRKALMGIACAEPDQVIR